MNQRRLDTVVRIRWLQERLARGDVAHRRGVLSASVTREAALWSAVTDRSSLTPEPLPAAALLAQRRLLDGGVKAARRSAGDVVAAQQHVELAMAEWAEAAQRREGMERLATRAEDVAGAEHAHRAGVELDDLVIARWNRS